MMDVSQMEDLPDELGAEDEPEGFDGLTWQDAIEALTRKISANKALLAACKHEADRIAKVADKAKDRIEKAKVQIKSMLTVAGERKVQVGTYTVYLSGARAEVDTTELDIDELPIELRSYKVAPDIKAIERALKQGEQVPGCKLVQGEESVCLKSR